VVRELVRELALAQHRALDYHDPQPQPASRRAESLHRGSGVLRYVLKREIRRVRRDLTSKRNRLEAARACCMCSCRR